MNIKKQTREDGSHYITKIKQSGFVYPAKLDWYSFLYMINYRYIQGIYSDK